MSTNSQRLRAIALRGLCGGWPELAEIGGDDDVRFAVDSPVEEDGFEPSVPRGRERTSRAKSDLQDDNRRRSIRQAE